MIDHLEQWVKIAEQQYADRIALICEDDSQITYRELIRQSIKLANVMKAAGVRTGDHIAVWLPNSPEWVRLEIACGLLGAVLVGLNPRYRLHELLYMIRHADCKMLFLGQFSEEVKETLDEMLPELFERQKADSFREFPLLEKVIFADSSGPIGAWGLEELFREFPGEQADDFSWPSSPGLPFNILFTSGTTSRPKGAILTQRAILGHSFNTAIQMEITEQDTCLTALPFCGVWGLNSLWQALLKGASIVIIDQFDIEKICGKIANYRCTVWNAVDQMYMKLLEYKQREIVDLSSLRIGTGGMFIYDGAEIISKVEAGIHYRILHTYGMTEIGSMLLLRDPAAPQRERVISGGRLTSGEVKIIHPDTLEELPENTVGEITVAGFNVTSGYYKRPEANEEAFISGGYFRTGDLGQRLPDGTIEYHGRLKEALRLSGFLVSPSEIEDFLEEIPAVDLAQVVGVQENQRTIVAAFIKLKNKHELSVEEIQEKCYQLARFKRPKHIFIVEVFPKSQGSNGEKIRRDLLMEMAKEKISQKEQGWV